MDYIRRTGQPVLAEFEVSRLYGHSSASGANRENALCCIETFERKLVNQKVISVNEVKALWTEFDNESRRAAETVRNEPQPTSQTIWNHVYVGNENADWRKF